MPIENVDTDQIIPARFLKATTRDGVRTRIYSATGGTRMMILRSPKADFVLNDPDVQG